MNDELRTDDMEFKGPPSYIPPKYTRPKRPVFLIIILCMAIGLGLFSTVYTVYVRNTDNTAEASEAESKIELSVAEQTSGNDTSDLTEGDFSLETVDAETYYTYRSVVALTADTVVEITTEKVVTSSYMRQYISEGAGSGVIITSDGYIVTNNHVIEEATTILVRLRNGEEYNAELVGRDPQTDIAVIKINAEGLKSATLGNSSSLMVGDQVIAIGNPLGKLGGTVTEGIISALERTISIDGTDMKLLQHSAAVSPGNSGGGLFDMTGSLIGIVNAKNTSEYSEGLAYAIPSNTAKPIIESIINYGYVKGRINFGVTAADIYDLSSYYSYYYSGFTVSEYGTYVYSLLSSSDAANAGIKSGDRIDSVNDVSITSSEVLESVISALSIGDTVKVKVTRYSYGWRGTTSEEKTFTFKVTEYIPD